MKLERVRFADALSCLEGFDLQGYISLLSCPFSFACSSEVKSKEFADPRPFAASIYILTISPFLPAWPIIFWGVIFFLAFFIFLIGFDSSI